MSAVSAVVSELTYPDAICVRKTLRHLCEPEVRDIT
jgi:hypothetical protein